MAATKKTKKKANTYTLIYQTPEGKEKKSKTDATSIEGAERAWAMSTLKGFLVGIETPSGVRLDYKH